MDKPYRITDSERIARLMDMEPSSIDMYDESVVYHYPDGAMAVYDRRTTTTQWVSWYPA